MTRQYEFSILLGMAFSIYSSYSAAQEWGFIDANTASVPGVEMSQGPLISPAGINNANGRSFGAPVVVLPVPLPAAGTSTAGPYGFQYPGSYIPRDTPLHRFNGYVVCDPPKLPGATVDTRPGSAAGSTRPRVVKITTTRSLAAPAYLQPCPIYTIDGEIQKSSEKSSGYLATTPR